MANTGEEQLLQLQDEFADAQPTILSNTFCKECAHSTAQHSSFEGMFLLLLKK